jgi:hypothetical protein
MCQLSTESLGTTNSEEACANLCVEYVFSKEAIFGSRDACCELSDNDCNLIYNSLTETGTSSQSAVVFQTPL